MNRGPFHRAIAMFAALRAIAMQTFANIALRQEALAALGPYKSRGKGRGGYQHSHRKVAMDKRDAQKARNRARHKRACR